MTTLAPRLSDEQVRERIASGRLMEGPQHASEDYLKALERTLIVSADTELISAPSYLGAAADAPDTSSYMSVLSIVQDEVGHAHIAYRMLRDLGVDTDEHPRADTTLEALAALRPVRSRIDAESTVTAGNASGQNDGAAVCIVTTSDKAEALGLRPLARLVSWGLAGVGPERMGIGPVPASEAALQRAGLTLADMDLIELNEAFAAQALAVTRTWGLDEKDHERVNVNGSGISLGHPVGATGARILATLLREMERREVRYGLETMCIGGGQGISAVFERIV